MNWIEFLLWVLIEFFGLHQIFNGSKYINGYFYLINYNPK